MRRVSAVRLAFYLARPPTVAIDHGLLQNPCGNWCVKNDLESKSSQHRRGMLSHCQTILEATDGEDYKDVNKQYSRSYEVLEGRQYRPFLYLDFTDPYRTRRAWVRIPLLCSRWPGNRPGSNRVNFSGTFDVTWILSLLNTYNGLFFFCEKGIPSSRGVPMRDTVSKFEVYANAPRFDINTT